MKGTKDFVTRHLTKYEHSAPKESITKIFIEGDTTRQMKRIFCKIIFFWYNNLLKKIMNVIYDYYAKL